MTTSNANQPLVSVVTPVYNGENYLDECIQSVVNQEYQNWEYIIVNNCSTDSTRDIAARYAKVEPRIRVIDNGVFVGVIENHNIAVRAISPASKYCKVLSADDWMYPECIAKLVALAERHPSIGIVGSCAHKGNGVRCTGLPPHTSVVSGREVCRLYLLGVIDFFGTPSSVLYRSDLVRAAREFFPGSNPNADVGACLNCLRDTDFGVVHQILSLQRVHGEAVSTRLRGMNSFLVDRMAVVVRYGGEFLTQQEREQRLEELLERYYAYLATAVVNLRSREFWRFHKERMEEIAIPLSYTRLARSTFSKVLDLLLNPKLTAERIVRRFTRNRSGSVWSGTAREGGAC